MQARPPIIATPIEALLFDVGGVLVHPDPTTMSRVLTGGGFSNAGPAFCERIFDILAMCSWRLREAPTELVRTAAARELCIPTEHLHEMLNMLDNADATFWTVIDSHAVQTLEILQHRGMALGVISNASGNVAERLAAKNLAKYFSSIVDSGTVGIRKPDTRIYALAAESVGKRSFSCGYVGDTPLEVCAAVDAGFGIGILFDRFSTFKSFQHPSCVTIRSLEDLR